MLEQGDGWRERIRGLRANASTRSHAELDEAEELDEGDPADLGARYAALREQLPRLCVLGGCCGTDHRHVARDPRRVAGQVARIVAIRAGPSVGRYYARRMLSAPRMRRWSSAVPLASRKRSRSTSGA